MRFQTGVKLDFNDVLIVPKRSTLTSRKDVKLTREFVFRNAKISWSGVPIIVSNMDTTGTFEMAKALFKFKLITCIHKHYSIEQWKKFITPLTEESFNYICVSTGISDKDLKKLDNILKLDERIKWICLEDNPKRLKI